MSGHLSAPRRSARTSQSAVSQAHLGRYNLRFEAAVACDYALFTGSANPELASLVARELAVELAPCAIARYPDGEVSVELGETVRRREVFLIQPTSPPVNERVMELILLADACRRSSPAKVTAIIPYFGYARGDKRQGHRVPVNARVVADLLQSAGIDHVVTLDAHTAQLEGFFRIPVENMSLAATLCASIASRLDPDAVIVSPDVGGVRRVREYARHLQRSVALCLKQRMSGATVEISSVVGDVRGRSCVIVDDMITSGGTVVESSRALLAAGAREVSAVVATHAVFAPGAEERLAEQAIRHVFVTDTVAHNLRSSSNGPEYHVVSVAPVLAAVIRRLLEGESLRPVG
jgi:ribose-phosphate pyrophosphokinase